MGLHAVGSAKSEADCCTACMNDHACITYGWCPAGAKCDSTQGVAGCWTGTSTNCHNTTDGWVARRRPTPPPRTGFLSYTLGDHMVLQRAPQQAVVWGVTAAGATVTTTFNGKSLTATADGNGTWRQKLPATAASTTAYSLTFSSSSGDTASLNDVLFGDVCVCGGQSSTPCLPPFSSPLPLTPCAICMYVDMQFSLPATTNASTEEAAADKYPHVRLFTVGQATSAATPLPDLQTIEQSWSVASAATIAGNGGFGYFSSVCWLFGKSASPTRPPSRGCHSGW